MPQTLDGTRVVHRTADWILLRGIGECRCTGVRESHARVAKSNTTTSNPLVTHFVYIPKCLCYPFLSAAAVRACGKRGKGLGRARACCSRLCRLPNFSDLVAWPASQRQPCLDASEQAMARRRCKTTDKAIRSFLSTAPLFGPIAQEVSIGYRWSTGQGATKKVDRVVLPFASFRRSHTDLVRIPICSQHVQASSRIQVPPHVGPARGRGDELRRQQWRKESVRHCRQRCWCSFEPSACRCFG